MNINNNKYTIDKFRVWNSEHDGCLFIYFLFKYFSLEKFAVLSSHTWTQLNLIKTETESIQIYLTGGFLTSFKSVN